MQLDDTIIKTIETAPSPELKEARELILRIRRRNLYQACFTCYFSVFNCSCTNYPLSSILFFKCSAQLPADFCVAVSKFTYSLKSLCESHFSYLFNYYKLVLLKLRKFLLSFL